MESAAAKGQQLRGSDSGISLDSAYYSTNMDQADGQDSRSSENTQQAADHTELQSAKADNVQVHVEEDSCYEDGEPVYVNAEIKEEQPLYVNMVPGLKQSDSGEGRQYEDRESKDSGYDSQKVSIYNTLEKHVEESPYMTAVPLKPSKLDTAQKPQKKENAPDIRKKVKSPTLATDEQSKQSENVYSEEPVKCRSEPEDRNTGSIYEDFAFSKSTEYVTPVSRPLTILPASETNTQTDNAESGDIYVNTVEETSVDDDAEDIYVNTVGLISLDNDAEDIYVNVSKGIDKDKEADALPDKVHPNDVINEDDIINDIKTQAVIKAKCIEDLEKPPIVDKDPIQKKEAPAVQAKQKPNPAKPGVKQRQGIKKPNEVYQASSLCAQFDLGEKGGFFELHQMNVSVMVPCSAIQKTTANTLRIAQVSHPAKVMKTNKQSKLLSEVYECTPHSESFGDKLTIKVPLTETPSRKSVVRVLYSHTMESVTFYPRKGTNGGSLDEGTVPDISWFIINQFCVVMIDRFCFLAVGADSEEKDKKDEASGGGHVNPGYQPPQGDRDGPGADGDGPGSRMMSAAGNTSTLRRDKQPTGQNSSGNQHNGTGPEGNNNNKLIANMFMTPILKEGKMNFKVTCQLEMKPSIEEARKSKLIDRDSSFDVPEKWIFPMQSKMLNNTSNSMILRFELQSTSFKLRMDSEILPLDITEGGELPWQSFYLEQKPGLIADDSCVSLLIEELRTPEEQTQPLFCIPCYMRRPESPALCQVEKLQHKISSEEIEDTRQELKKRNTYFKEKKDKKEATEHDEGDDTDTYDMEYADMDFTQPLDAAPIPEMDVDPEINDGHNDVAYEENIAENDFGRIRVISCEGFNINESEAKKIVQEMNRVSPEFKHAINMDFLNKLGKLDPATIEDIAEDMRYGPFYSRDNLAQMFVIAMSMADADINAFRKLSEALKQRRMQECYEVLKFELEKENIRNCKDYVCDSLRIVRFSGCLYTEGILCCQEKALMDIKESDREKMEYLVDNVVLKLGQTQFYQFVQILKESGHKEVVSKFMTT